MSDVAILISGIERKLRKLIDRQQELEDEIRNSKKEITELIQNNEEQKRTIQRLEEKIRNLKISNTIGLKEDALEAKSKINELVREIDKCMGLLNT